MFMYNNSRGDHLARYDATSFTPALANAIAPGTTGGMSTPSTTLQEAHTDREIRQVRYLVVVVPSTFTLVRLAT